MALMMRRSVMSLGRICESTMFVRWAAIAALAAGEAEVGAGSVIGRCRAPGNLDRPSGRIGATILK
jgi:hypothetical protein